MNNTKISQNNSRELWYNTKITTHNQNKRLVVSQSKKNVTNKKQITPQKTNKN